MAGRIEEARVVFGGAAPIPWRSPAAERSLLGTRAEAAAGERAAQRALEEAAPLAKNGYKAVLLRSLLRRAVEALAPDPP